MAIFFKGLIGSVEWVEVNIIVKFKFIFKLSNFDMKTNRILGVSEKTRSKRHKLL